MGFEHLNDKLEDTIRSKLEGFARDHAARPKDSQSRRSVDDAAFDYINSIPKEHLRQRYVREYYALRSAFDGSGHERGVFQHENGIDEGHDYWGV